MLDQRRRRWANAVQMLYKCFVFAGICIFNCRLWFQVYEAKNKCINTFFHERILFFILDRSQLTRASVSDSRPTLLLHRVNNSLFCWVGCYIFNVRTEYELARKNAL